MANIDDQLWFSVEGIRALYIGIYVWHRLLTTPFHRSLPLFYKKDTSRQPSSVVKCLREVFIWGFGVLFLSCVCVCRCRGCCSLSVCMWMTCWSFYKKDTPPAPPQGDSARRPTKRPHKQAWPVLDRLTLVFVCARINHPFFFPAHLHYPHYCNTIARRSG